MARLLMRALFPIITLWSPPWLSSQHFQGDVYTNHLIVVTCSWRRVNFIHNNNVYRALAGIKPSLVIFDGCAAASVPEQLLTIFPGRVLSFCSIVPGHIRTCIVLLLRGGCVLSAQSELWNHPQIGMSWPSDRWQLHEKICQGNTC